MAYYTIKFFSNALRRNVTFDMVIPNDEREDAKAEQNAHTRRRMKTILLLHGYTGDASTFGLEEEAVKYNFALVMPNGENGFYLDGEATGQKYASYVGVELIDYVRKTFGLAMTPEETYVTGLSMGGFGALHTALSYPERFGKAACLSSALIVHEIAHMKPGQSNEVANYAYYRQRFGDLETVEQRDVNPEVLAERIRKEGGRMPELYLCCGTEDFLIEKNRQFHHFLEELGVKHDYHESKGIHDMVFWDEYFPKAMEWFFADEV